MRTKSIGLIIFMVICLPSIVSAYGRAALIALGCDRTTTTGLRVGGASVIDVSGGEVEGEIQVNCDSCAYPRPAIYVSSFSEIEASQINVVGCYDGPEVDYPIVEGAAYMPDPLGCFPDYQCIMPPPHYNEANDLSPVPGVPWSPDPCVSVNILSPGYYSGGIDIRGGNVVFQPGIYVLDGEICPNINAEGGLKINGGIIDASGGVMFYILGGSVDIGGNPILTINELVPWDGSDEVTLPYEGMLIYQDPDNITPARIIGTSDVELVGTIYFPFNHIEIGGEGYSVGNQLIAKSIRVHTSGGGIIIDYDGRNSLPVLVGLEIIGPNEVAEEFQTQYTAIAHYDNNSTLDVTGLAVWSVEPNTVANIDAGLLETGEIYEPQDIAIYAQYSEDNNTVEAEREVTILPICPYGYALDFDGSGDYVEIANEENFDFGSDNDFSICAWIKTTATFNRRRIVNKSESGHEPYTGIGFFMDPPGVVKFRLKDDADRAMVTTTTTVNDGFWHFIAGVADRNGDLQIYHNGILEDADSLALVDNINNDIPLAIGRSMDYNGQYFDGIIDDVRIYDRALSAEEIQASMHTRPSLDEPNLVACWGFDEGEGQVAYDSSPYNNDGTLGSTDGVDDSDPEWVESDAPIGICYHVDVDIKPGSCPNPLNLISQGIFPVAILGSEDFDVNSIYIPSIRLADAAIIRHSYEDVSTPVPDGNECDCTEEGPDGYTDLTLKFRNQEVIEQLMKTEGELAKDQVLNLTLRAVISDGMVIEGSDCVKLIGNVPKWLATKMVDVNADGVIDFHDYAMLAKQWLESY